MVRGPCAKRQVICWITAGGKQYRGENDCANPQPACPRLEGEGYEKCKTICQQAGHAEIEAIRAAQADGRNLTGAKARLFGHYWICEPCGAALRDAGVWSIELVYQRGNPWE